MAWEVYELLNSQFVYDFHLAPFILQTCGIEYHPVEWALLFKKLTCIHGLIKQHKEDNGGK